MPFQAARTLSSVAGRIAPLPDLEQLGAGALDVGGELAGVDPALGCHVLDRDRSPEHVRALPVALGDRAERPRDRLAGDLDELGPRPDEEPPLDTLAVRVLGGGEPAAGLPELPQQVLAGLDGDAAVRLVPRHLPRADVQAGEQRVVVEHLLEVRHVPPGIGRVPMEAAPHLVVHAAGRHPVERPGHELERVRVPPQVHPQEELERHRLRELRGAAEPAPARVERAPQVRDGAGQDLLGERLGGGREPGRSVDRFDDPRALRLDLVAAVRPDVGDRGEHRPERRHAVPGFVREVRPRVEGPAVGQQERRQRPSAAARSSRGPRPCRSRPGRAVPRGPP